MAKPKFTLNPAPTFPATVAIPVPGAAPADVEFTFKHRTRDEFRAFLDGLPGRDNVEAILDVASGWDLDDPFDAAALERLSQNYIGAASAVIDTYVSELTGARRGN